jgi:hypothetical protein
MRASNMNSYERVGSQHTGGTKLGAASQSRFEHAARSAYSLPAFLGLRVGAVSGE